MSKEPGNVTTNRKSKSQIPSLEAVPTRGFDILMLPVVIYRELRATSPAGGGVCSSTKTHL